MATQSLPTVLIVDDVKYTRDSIKKLMSKWHIKTDEAEDGVEAIEKQKKREYSLVLLDLKMPNKDGLDVLLEMKNLNISTPVILITAYPYDERVKAALKYNIDLCNLCLVKPISPSELKKAVKRFISVSSE